MRHNAPAMAAVYTAHDVPPAQIRRPESQFHPVDLRNTL